MKKSIKMRKVGAYSFRLLELNDLEQTLQWRNRPNVRKWFKNSHIVDREMHFLWFEAYHIRENDYVFIAEVEGRAIGQMAVYDIADDTAEVGRFIVAPEFEGQGIMKQCLKDFFYYVCDLFRLKTLYLEVYSDNKKAINIYNALGFFCVGEQGGLQTMRYTYAKKN